MEVAQMETILESILFAAGEPLELSRLSEALEVDDKACESILAHMTDVYNAEKRGLQILRLGECYQLATRSEYADYIRKALDNRRESPLSGASLEVLAIVAYNHPTTKGYIEQIRGVDSSSSVNTLVDKGLLEDCGKLDVPGHPRLYRTTTTFLRCFGLSSLEELPPLTPRENAEGEIEGQLNLEESS